MPAIFYHNDKQKTLANESKKRLSERVKDTIQTKLLPLNTFYWAEDYHQKYWLRQKLILLNEFNKIYPMNRDFVNSTSAARVNAYVSGQRTHASLLAEIDSLGLSPDGREKLLDIVKIR